MGISAAAWPAWKKSFLAAIGAPDTAANEGFLNAWLRKESGGYSGGAVNNPFNTTLYKPGSSIFNSVKVRNYPSPEVGGQATAQTLTQGPYVKQYADLVAGFRSGNISTSQNFVGLKVWSSGNVNSKKGYWNLSGISTTTPGTNSKATGTQDSTAGTGSLYVQEPGATPSTTDCYWKLSLPSIGPLGGGGICMDNVIWTVMILSGGVLAVAGLTLVAVGVGSKNKLINNATQAGAAFIPGVGLASQAGRAVARTKIAQQEADTRSQRTALSAQRVEAGQRSEAAENLRAQQAAERIDLARRQEARRAMVDATAAIRARKASRPKSGKTVSATSTSKTPAKVT